MAKQSRWCRDGALFGTVLVLGDYFLEWRGPQYYPWVGPEAIAQNIGQMAVVIGIPALIGFVAGKLADRLLLRGLFKYRVEPPVRNARPQILDGPSPKKRNAQN